MPYQRAKRDIPRRLQRGEPDKEAVANLLAVKPRVAIKLRLFLAIIWTLGSPDAAELIGDHFEYALIFWAINQQTMPNPDPGQSIGEEESCPLRDHNTTL